MQAALLAPVTERSIGKSGRFRAEVRRAILLELHGASALEDVDHVEELVAEVGDITAGSSRHAFVAVTISHHRGHP
jgi:hypothetical protein